MAKAMTLAAGPLSARIVLGLRPTVSRPWHRGCLERRHRSGRSPSSRLPGSVGRGGPWLVPALASFQILGSGTGTSRTVRGGERPSARSRDRSAITVPEFRYEDGFWDWLASTSSSASSSPRALTKDSRRCRPAAGTAAARHDARSGHGGAQARRRARPDGKRAYTVTRVAVMLSVSRPTLYRALKPEGAPSAVGA